MNPCNGLDQFSITVYYFCRAVCRRVEKNAASFSNMYNIEINYDGRY